MVFGCLRVLQRKNHLNQTFIIVLHANFQGSIIVDTIPNGIDHQEIARPALLHSLKLTNNTDGRGYFPFRDAIFSGAMLHVSFRGG